MTAARANSPSAENARADLASNFVTPGSETEADTGPGAGQDGIAGNATSTEVLMLGRPGGDQLHQLQRRQDWYQVTLGPATTTNSP